MSSLATIRMNANEDTNFQVLISLINDIKLASDQTQRGPINIDWRKQNAQAPAINVWVMTIHPDTGALGYDIEVLLPRFATPEDDDNEEAAKWLGRFNLALSESRGDAAFSINLAIQSDGTTMKITRAA